MFNMINLIINKILKKEQKQLSTPKTHYVKIILEVEYVTGKSVMIYSNSYEITHDNHPVFIKLREEKTKEYTDAIKAIHINLDDKSSEFININNSILIKKSDFTNARILYKYE
jgi:nitrate reductase gamma subunit